MSGQENGDAPTGPSLVCVTPYVPHPGIDHAGGAFLHAYVVEASRSGWRVRVLAPDTPDNRAALTAVAPAVETLLYEAPSGLLTKLSNVARDGVPATTGARWLGLLPSQAREWLRGADVVDLQWADSIWNAPVLRAELPDALLIGLAHDIRTESLRRALRAGRGRPRIEAVLGLPRARVRERDSVNSCRQVGVFKAGDRDTLRRMGVTTETTILPIILPQVSAIASSTPASRRCLFVAAFHRPENAEGALWFLDEVWPHVRRAVPGAIVRLAGSRPPTRLLARAADDVEVTGYLPDLSAAYTDVACAVVPLRRGAGVKFKTVEALLAGYPVIATTVGAEGVQEVAQVEPTAVTNDPLAFAEAVSRVLLGAGGPEGDGARPEASRAISQPALGQHFRDLRRLLDQRPRARS